MYTVTLIWISLLELKIVKLQPKSVKKGSSIFDHNFLINKKFNKKA